MRNSLIEINRIKFLTSMNLKAIVNSNSPVYFLFNGRVIYRRCFVRARKMERSEKASLGRRRRGKMKEWRQTNINTDVLLLTQRQFARILIKNLEGSRPVTLRLCAIAIHKCKGSRWRETINHSDVQSIVKRIHHLQNMLIIWRCALSHDGFAR